MTTVRQTPEQTIWKGFLLMKQPSQASEPLLTRMIIDIYYCLIIPVFITIGFSRTHDWYSEKRAGFVLR